MTIPMGALHAVRVAPTMRRKDQRTVNALLPHGPSVSQIRLSAPQKRPTAQSGGVLGWICTSTGGRVVGNAVRRAYGTFIVRYALSNCLGGSSGLLHS